MHKDEDLFRLIRQELYTPVVGDILDTLSRYHQFLPQPVQPMLESMILVGRAMPVLMIDVHGPQKKPFGLLTEALDDLKPGEVYMQHGDLEIMGDVGAFPRRLARVEQLRSHHSNPIPANR